MQRGGSILQKIVLAIVMPLALLMLAVLALERWGNQLHPWLQRIIKRRSLIWNTGIGMIIVLS